MYFLYRKFIRLSFLDYSRIKNTVFHANLRLLINLDYRQKHVFGGGAKMKFLRQHHKKICLDSYNIRLTKTNVVFAELVRGKKKFDKKSFITNFFLKILKSSQAKKGGSQTLFEKRRQPFFAFPKNLNLLERIKLVLPKTKFLAPVCFAHFLIK
jgi:hypothetical protein